GTNKNITSSDRSGASVPARSKAEKREARRGGWEEKRKV
ncbi:hypothetical protein L345_18512, partial [Ophiophagus hannah]